MLRTAIIGASGYTGAVLCALLSRHPEVTVDHLYVSEQSQDAGKPIAALHGSLAGICELPLEPLKDSEALQVGRTHDAVFLCTAHKVSHDLTPALIEGGARVFDLSGAFRVNAPDFYTDYYGFEHCYPQLLEKAVYALCEWVDLNALRKTPLISLPGCYPTVSQLSLKPLLVEGLLDPDYTPAINAVSGVSGAGRGAKLSSMFCEVSLNAYGLFTHRHTPEIAAHLGTEVIFNPHLGNFKRGIHATLTARLKEGVTAEAVRECYVRAYAGHQAVRLKNAPVKLDDVVHSPYCDIFAAVKGRHIVITGAIDNLMKGASSQAVQAFNLAYSFDEMTALR